jgi:hypothetical protein
MWPVVSEAQRRHEKESPTFGKKVLKPPEGELGFVKLLLVSSLITLSPDPFRCVGV